MFFPSLLFFLSILLISFFFPFPFSIVCPLVSPDLLHLLRFFFRFISSFSLYYRVSCFTFSKSCSSLTICPSNPGSILGSKQTWTVQLTPLSVPCVLPTIMHHACDSRQECMCFTLTLMIPVHFGTQNWRYPVGIWSYFRRTSAKVISCSYSRHSLNRALLVPFKCKSYIYHTATAQILTQYRLLLFLLKRSQRNTDTTKSYTKCSAA
jgi:hypothetical protein